jgi:hypothetical protein
MHESLHACRGARAHDQTSFQLKLFWRSGSRPPANHLTSHGTSPAAAFGISAIAHAKRSLQSRFNPAALLRRCEERAAALRSRFGLAGPSSRIPHWRRRGRYLGLPTDALRRILFSVAAALCNGAAVAQEQNPAPVQQQQISETQAVALLIQLGRLDETKLVLVHVLQVTPNDNEAIFPHRPDCRCRKTL